MPDGNSNCRFITIHSEQEAANRTESSSIDHQQEIVIPPWRNVDEPQISAGSFKEESESSEIVNVSEAGSDEDTSDERYAYRHRRMEQLERKTRVPLRDRKKFVRQLLVTSDYPTEYGIVPLEKLERFLASKSSQATAQDTSREKLLRLAHRMHVTKEIDMQGLFRPKPQARTKSGRRRTDHNG
mmetsp:Transcript_9383/g.16154  ORF Transcript_9383/g.16154 Transcript_9383/m.16154 type:complete len:184 (-) Transcript_9383:493-1044(-)|eukprot:CAMPEP_0196654712 /NCGR_PEP_ID=MMETSP1086-20130531/4434_1 /TAXON_ID=77921 /ORGANISM="Cyanoptyche  gloeocystis , Strain SAG4.97" /LENGTH=183 /DNA_ID=CAMNT_0041986629 /DNA_START=43 /DNA_END=594 /DNA_ORIENTATION=-